MGITIKLRMLAMCPEVTASLAVKSFASLAPDILMVIVCVCVCVHS
jgi:hypothetical protein